MQIIRFKAEDEQIYYGCEYDGETACLIEGDIYTRYKKTEKRMGVDRLLPPVDPRAILCIGLNYRAHAKETGMPLPQYPVVFMKNPAAAAAHKDDVVIPDVCAQKPEVDYEAELAAVIGKKARNVSPEDALDCVLGYACANDISARRWQKHAGGGQWVKGKSFDTFCPFGPWLVTPEEIGDPGNLEIECVLNGKTMQKSNTSDMIFPVARIISYLSQSMTLLPGTLILTGTPSGVGFTREPPVFLKHGDSIEIRLEKIGTLQNNVRDEE